MLDQLLEEIARLKKGHDLLAAVHLAVGYGRGELPEELLHAINNYFGFDDSE